MTRPVFFPRRCRSPQPVLRLAAVALALVMLTVTGPVAPPGDTASATPGGRSAVKEYEWTYSPDYPANLIRLKPQFFAEVADDKPVTLTFHFPSGTKVTYHVTKSGSSVTGMTA